MKIPFTNYYWENGGRFTARALRRLGVRHIFSIAGAQTLSIWNAVPGTRGLELVVPRSEWNSAFMGEGYGLAGGYPAVVMDTVGPGVGNEVIGIQSAVDSRSPVLLVSPDQPRFKVSRIGHVFQGLNQQAFFKGMPKANFRVWEPSGLGQVLSAARKTCLLGRQGPVRVDVAFPMFFLRKLFTMPPKATGPDPLQSSLILVRESKAARPDLTDRLGVDEAECQQLAPGIGQPGFAAPFALGAKFSRRDTPVALFTETTYLLNNLDSISLAIYHGIAVNLVTGTGYESDVAENAARTFGAEFFGNRSDAQIKGIVLDHPQALTIVVA